MKDGGRKDSGRVSRAQHQQGRHRRMREDAATKKEKEKAMMHEELEAAVAAALQAAIAAALDAAVAAWRSRQHRVPGKVQSKARRGTNPSEVFASACGPPSKKPGGRRRKVAEDKTTYEFHRARRLRPNRRKLQRGSGGRPPRRS